MRNFYFNEDNSSNGERLRKYTYLHTEFCVIFMQCNFAQRSGVQLRNSKPVEYIMGKNAKKVQFSRNLHLFLNRLKSMFLERKFELRVSQDRNSFFYQLQHFPISRVLCGGLVPLHYVTFPRNKTKWSKFTCPFFLSQHFSNC